MIIGTIYPKTNRAWSSMYGYRSFRGSAFYGEAPKPNTTYFCAENTSSCLECYSCCGSQFANLPSRRAGCERRCRRKFPADTCTGTPGTCPPGYEMQDGKCVVVAPAGAEQCPVVCVPDGTGVTCHHNCMGMTEDIINTDVPGEVITLHTAHSLFDRSRWLQWLGGGSASYLPTGAGTYVPPSTAGTTGVTDVIGSAASNLPTLLLLGGGGFVLYKIFSKK